MSELQVVGKGLPRIEGPEKVSGRTLFAADIVLPGMLHAKILRSTHAHARIKHIDTSAAKALPGVHAVVTAADLPPGDRDPSIRAHVVLADDEVFFHGQAVAAVAADSIDIAEEAIDLIRVEYEPLPVVMDLEAAAREDSPPTRTALGEIDRVEEGGHVTVEVNESEQAEAKRPVNVTNRLVFKRGDAEKGFADADYVVEGRFDSAQIHQAYLEPQVTVAWYGPNRRLTIYTPTQGQFFQRAEVARILGLPQSHVRYISTECGGGFGAKVAPLVQPLVALLSMKSKRPVKLVLSRREDLAVAVPAPRGLVIAKIGARKDGTLTTLKAKVMFDAGAFPSGPVIGAALMIAGNYKFQNLDVEGLEVITNKVSCGAYRAPGLPEVTFAAEQLVDEICRLGGFDQIDLRRKNAVQEGDLMPNGRPWPRIGLIECLDALEKSDLWQAHKHLTHKHRGIGVAVGGWPGGMQAASAIIRLNEGGTAQVIVGSNDISGTLTSFAQIAAEELGVPMSLVDAVTGDTDSAPFAGMAAGSKTLYSGGRSVQSAARDARDQILQIAAHELNANIEDLVIENGVVLVPDTDKSITFARVAALSTGFGGRYSPVLGRGGEVIRNQAPGFTAQAVEVEVDPATGELTVTGAAAAQDVGKAINTLTVTGQLEGGVTQGLGMGLTEEMIYDEHGRLRNPTFLDYRLPTALDIPNIEGLLVEVPSAEGAYGARMVGEPSIIAGSTALANAVRDITGVRLHYAPLTPERVSAAIREGQKAAV